MDTREIDVLLLMIGVLEKLGVPYCIGGSWASSIHGMWRATNDADLVAAIEPKHVSILAAELEAEFYADEQAIARAVRAKQSFNVIHLGTMFKVDVFVSKQSGFDAMQLERREGKPVAADSERFVWVASAEDTVLAKLDWYRRGNEVSDRQWRDILNVLKVQSGRLDLTHLRHWAEELRVLDLLEEALREAEHAEGDQSAG
ncbi:MAG TPA: hypothetical protein VJH03_22865 [Blastocatellia bacterium]|nr:hypothetical protein [Blastocatellia bacterium]